MSEAIDGTESGRQDLEHLRLLAIFHFIVAAIAACLSLLSVVHIGMGIAMLSGAFNLQSPVDRRVQDATPHPGEQERRQAVEEARRDFEEMRRRTAEALRGADGSSTPESDPRQARWSRETRDEVERLQRAQDALIRQHIGSGEEFGGLHRMAGWILLGAGTAYLLVGLAFALLLAFAGRSLQKRRRYTYCFVIACIACLFMPVGTVLGVFTIVVLSRTSVKTLFGRGVQAPAA